MIEIEDDHLEFLSLVLLINEKTDLMLDSIEIKLTENPTEDKVLVNTKALVTLHLLLSTQKSLVNSLVEQNEQTLERLTEFVAEALKP